MMRLRFILFLLLSTLFFSLYAWGEDLSPEEAVTAFLSALEKERIFPYSDLMQPYTLLPRSEKQEQRTNFYLRSVPTGVSLLHPRTLVRSTDMASSYLFSLNDRSKENGYVGYARVNRVTVTELRKLSENEYRAEFMLGYTVGSFGSLLFGREMYLQRPQDALIDYRDNGWRVKLIKTF